MALLRQSASGASTVLEADHLVGRRHLHVDRHGEGRERALQIVVADMPAILAQMHGDPVRARRDRHARGVQRIGVRAAARIAHGGDVVDVHAQPDRSHGAGGCARARAAASSAAVRIAAYLDAA